MNKFSHFIKHKHTSAELRGQKSEVRGLKSGVRGQGSEIRGLMSGVRGQGSEV